MTTKIRPATIQELIRDQADTVSDGKVYPGTPSYFRYTSGAESISYADGPRLASGRWPWKECTHSSNGRWSAPFLGSFQGEQRWTGNPKAGTNYKCNYPPPQFSLPTPDATFDRSALQQVLDQIDLNSADNVLLYSGVIQAVPLLGGVAKFTSILNGVARTLSKGMRRQPFTTVVKGLISADFIDRFVISPMIDDARRFADATNYVLRVIETARQRSASRFALQSAVTTVHSEQSGNARINPTTGGNAPYLDAHYSIRNSTTSKAFMLLEAKYDMLAIDPIKIWAQRVGLTRPLDSVWDLVPFSFVVDYFTRAGDFISALSDEMSSVEGLKGSITKIHDLWYTVNAEASLTFSDLRMKGDELPSYMYWATNVKSYNSDCSLKRSIFVRQRVTNPWGLLLSLYDRRINDFLSLQCPTSIQKRTIAELIIQAKL